MNQLPATIALILALGAVSSSAAAIQQDPFPELREQIITANLINGLYLSSAQMQEILRLGKAMQREQDRIRRAHHQDRARLERLLTRYRDEVIRGEEPNQETVAEVARELARIRGRHRRLIERLGDELYELLDESQLFTIQTFVPCLVPHIRPGEGPPIGAAVSSSGPVSRLLDHGRDVPPGRYRLVRQRLADRFVHYLQHEYTDEVDPENARARFLEILDRARRLSDLEYRLQRPELVSAALPAAKYRRRSSVEEIKAKASRYLLSSTAIQILEQKLQQQ